MNNSNLDLLIKFANFIANKNHDGHLTIMKFTTGWKTMFGTPNLDSGRGREEVRSIPMSKNISESLLKAIEQEI